jgi:lipopolysaccharide/colanic/teichoic acid biosynthesis glycosyltransferase
MLDTLARLTLGSSILLSAYPVFIYPRLARLLAHRRRPESSETFTTPGLPEISILVPAHNEAATIEAKLNDIRGLNYPPDKLEILVCSDGSNDGTDDIVRRVAGPRTLLLRNERRRGKTATVNRLVASAKHPLVLLTDASAALDADALQHLVRAISAANVGVAAAAYIRDASGTSVSQGESEYWTKQDRMRQWESDAGLLASAHGAAYLARRALVPVLPIDTINDDYTIPFTIRAAGARVVHVPQAIAIDRGQEASADVRHRLARITRGNLQMTMRLFRLPAGDDRRVLLGLVAKATKSLLPLWLALGGAASLVLWPTATLTLAIAALASVAYATLAAKSATPPNLIARVGALLSYVALALSGQALGALQATFGVRQGPWRSHTGTTALAVRGPSLPPRSVRIAKRAVDVIAATFGLAVMGIPMLVIAGLVRRGSAGPAIYAQRRVYVRRDGSLAQFTMFKFRTMVADAEVGTGPIWATEDDPRITGLGNRLRKARLDELPQLFNLLLGDMSLVGPRPERAHFTKMLAREIPGYHERLMGLKPGITGLAQIHCEYDTSIDSVREKLLYDFAYALSLQRFRDYVRIEATTLLETVRVVLTGRGAH